MLVEHLRVLLIYLYPLRAYEGHATPRQQIKTMSVVQELSIMF